MQWHGTICIVKVFLLSEREVSPKYSGIFLHFVHGFGSYVKGLPKTKRCNSVAVTVSVRFRFRFGVYVKRPLSGKNIILSILPFQMHKIIIFQEKKIIEIKICMPTLPKVFRPVTRNTLIFLFGLI